ncbi:MAG: adenosine kinase [Neomegalonema sp.]|nr:adenosine kinase [Neomegalonema sp.]
MSHRLDVIGMGAAIVDILARVDDPFLAQHNIAKGGMTLVDSARAEEIYAAMGPATESSGGSAGNTIASLAMLGASVQFVGKVKDDQLGKIFTHDIRAAGASFETAPIAGDAAGATARSMILITPDAERSMCTDLGISNQLFEADMPTEALANARVVYLEGYLWDREETKTAFRRAMEITKAAGGEAALTLSDAFCVDRHRESFRQIIQGDVEILFANEAELQALYQTEDFDAALAQVGSEVGTVAVTRSAQGVAIMRKGERIDVPTRKIAKLVDTTGAGDAFAAGFLYGHVNGASAQTCGEMGNAAASVVIQQIGPRPRTDLKAVFRDLSLV